MQLNLRLDSLQACLVYPFDGELFKLPTDAQLSLEFWYTCPPFAVQRCPVPLTGGFQ